jgi:hypothetical protein
MASETGEKLDVPYVFVCGYKLVIWRKCQYKEPVASDARMVNETEQLLEWVLAGETGENTLQCS